MRLFFLTNAISFQACWWIAALYTQQAALAMIVLLLIHFGLSPSKKLDSKIILLAVMGIAIDQLLISTLVLSVGQSIVPLWLALLWAKFCVSLNHSLRWLVTMNKWLVSLIGALFGSLSYIAAWRLGALSTPLTWQAFLLIEMALWALLMPLFCWLTTYIWKQEEGQHA